MKKKEWEKRQALDLAGVQALGSALYMRACFRWDVAKKELAEREIAQEPVNVLEWPHDFGHYQKEVRNWECQCEELEQYLTYLNTPEDIEKSAGKLRAKDFRFRWDHFRDHRILIGFVSDDQPTIAANWDLETPICERWGDKLTNALRSIFVYEFRLLTGPDPDNVPLPINEEDILFYLTIWKLCEPEKSRGGPKGRRWDDGAKVAASLAYSIRAEEEKRGTPISNDEACRRALESFDIIDSDEFAAHKDQNSVVVSNGLGEGGQKGGALKAVRKILSEFDR